MIRLLAIFLLLSVYSCGQAQDPNTITNYSNPDWKTLKGSNYTIQYPQGWELNESGQMGTAFILFAPLDSIQDQFKENVNLLIQNLSGLNVNLDKYAEVSAEQIKKSIMNSIIIENKRIKNSSEEYHLMIYTGDQGAFHLKFEQHYWIKDQKAYVLTLTCEQDKFTKYKDTGESILNTFTFD